MNHHYEPAFYAGTYLNETERAELNRLPIEARRKALRARASIVRCPPPSEEDQAIFAWLEYDARPKLPAFVQLIPAPVDAHVERVHAARGRLFASRDKVIALALGSDGRVYPVTQSHVEPLPALAVDGHATFGLDADIPERDACLRYENATRSLAKAS